jgi:hypothetical protein
VVPVTWQATPGWEVVVKIWGEFAENEPEPAPTLLLDRAIYTEFENRETTEKKPAHWMWRAK